MAKINKEQLRKAVKEFKEASIEDKILKKDIVFNEMLNRLEKKSREVILERIEKDGFQKYLVRKDGNVYIRCQSKLVNKEKQCPTKAEKELFCNGHYKNNKMTAIKKVISDKSGLYSVYQGKEFKALQGELEEIGELPEEFFSDVTPEIILVLTLLRKMMKEYSNEDLMRRPGLLTGKDGVLTRLQELKKTHFDQKHSPKVVFTIEQVEMLLLEMKNIVLEAVKDENDLQKIADGFRKAAIKFKEYGWKGNKK